ncbi:cadherin-7 [Labeo rohita]|uniref:Cadherin-7 n=1 Tax=Labeo rohita TaxID=84645 RepID=A0A498NFJ6_LABRO|nr:cadherin-7 [Labeo rohita]
MDVGSGTDGGVYAVLQHPEAAHRPLHSGGHLQSYQYSVLESVPVPSVVAKLKATDADIDSNAEMDYHIIDGDAPGVFNVTTDEETQEGVIFLQRSCVYVDI